ncbi:SWT21-like protein [Saccharomyces kudriavzevii IFO 1802]|uniref:Protein SWT21 n=2 Tax=Saccharomyces kudriavzevii (strain ATCC MYA-4449 / AS 2.2408 / CBS 8840 / NBRC 1802 / NCYC 2889) TaxID=226230 RepID=J5S0L1_SACK1|nr:SWT21-like protein [Saccharomyces kudriavzevii IFO 1802]
MTERTMGVMETMESGVDTDRIDIAPYCDTGKVFEGNTIQDVWEREDKKWLQKTQSEASGYVYPPLGQSPYSSVTSDTRMAKRVLCQDIFWSCDGTSFVSVHSDFGIRQYLVPEEVDTCKRKKTLLLPFSRFFRNQSIVSCALDPFYSLYDGTSGGITNDKIVIAAKNFPLQLYSIMDGKCVASYETTNEANEEYETAYSVKIDAEAHIYTGSHRNKVAVYDMHRREVVWTYRSTKKASKGGQTIISCFEDHPAGSHPPRGTLLCGSYANEVFQVDCRHKRLERMNHAGKAASGIVQILTSDNGRYIYVVRRNSDAISVYDRRVLQREVNMLALPFRIRHDSAKYKACMDSIYGLSMGTPWGTVLNWSRDLVEFGGVSSHRAAEKQTSVSIPPESEWYIHTDSDVPAMAVLKNCPGDPDLLALAHGGTISLGRLGG